MHSELTWAVGATLLLAAATVPAQFVDVTAKIEVTSWRYQEETGLPLKRSATYSVHCVVGTNAWHIEHDASSSYKENVWFMDGNIIRQMVPNPDSLADDTGFGAYRRGSRSASILASPDGYPAGDLFLNLPWFAFCSGPYLKRPKRSLPLPTPTQAAAFGFSDETTVFEDSLGLPRHVRFFTGQRQLKCDYKVQQFTNVAGWNFPTAFTVVQNEPDDLGIWQRQLTASGSVTSIHRAKKLELPVDIQQRLKFLEQSPRRKR